jgi:hypothetical protein
MSSEPEQAATTAMIIQRFVMAGGIARGAPA